MLLSHYSGGALAGLAHENELMIHGLTYSMGNMSAGGESHSCDGVMMGLRICGSQWEVFDDFFNQGVMLLVLTAVFSV